ncbi:preprotein translocase subunit SecA [Tautonia sociabilis]|uniref:Protein translocase subunit SecA n=1 Tax=Tautonia sociabilis TaxID=2080755 RepID=A0A432MJ41_9BACT|nr:preprotein translocase subunit SecA [Tautonia sociabilis]RUL87383.1 preprotein translocase subunit SecA [Tautonia sociabilis]
MEATELLSDIWDKTTNALNAFSEGVSNGLVRIFGNSNERQIRRMQPIVARINELERTVEGLSDDELKAKSAEFRRRLAEGETLDEILPEAFAVCREGGKRFLKMRHYDVQLLGGIVLHEGKIAEMVTGEGKTLVATLAAYLNALEGKGVHVVTVNDYLARRDAEWMSPLYNGLGLSVGAIQSQMDPRQRQRIYGCDITYGTNNEFGFDYLRDNMKPTREAQAQGPLHYAIIDEVDSILIDEARTPLIISGPAFDDVRKYAEADRIARQLREGQHFEVKEKERTAHLTEEGIREAERLAGVESFFTPGNMEWPHLIDNALKAHHLYKRDREYVVSDKGEIIIVDEFTGRLMVGRQWSDGLHQAVEAKERVKIKEENQTLATITLQNFFKLYTKLSGMTGTAMTEANEFWKVYKLDVVAIPTNRPLQRINEPDVIFRTEKEKFHAIIDEIREVHRTGRPILVGTTSIEKSELLSEMLKRYGIPHQVLNAKYHEQEAEIVAQAGRKGKVTIATNMAGRGTDIILGGNPEFMAWADLSRLKNEDGRPLYPTRLEVPPQVWKEAVAKYEPEMKAEGREVAELGGLHIIGTERHESRRIDNQLRGRSGRQGDPGSSRFFLSLQDDLMRKFAGEWVSNVLQRLGMQDGEAIESKLVTRRIEGAQKKVEERNFDARKNLLEYDEVMDTQRKGVYSFRQRLLDGAPTKDEILAMIDRQIDLAVEQFLDQDYGPSSFAAWVGQRLGVEFEGRDFRGDPFEEAAERAKDRAEAQAADAIDEAIEENLPSEAEPSEWNWIALTGWANARYGLNLKDRDLRKFQKGTRDEVELDRVELADFIREQAVAKIRETDLEPAREFLTPDWGTRSLAGWVHRKFGLTTDPADWAGKSPEDVSSDLKHRARELYARKEAEFPVRVGMSRFLVEPKPGQPARYDREGLAAWASERFGTPVDVETLKPLLRPEMEALLVGIAHETYPGARLYDELQAKLDAAFDDDGDADRERLAELSHWARQQLGIETTVEELAELGEEGTRSKLVGALDAKHRPEMREMEKVLLLQILDQSWMEHLRTMDHLRSSIGLRGYAQVDPKVEYKREGKRIYDEMWQSISDKITDLVFRMEQVDPDFLSYLGARWQLDRARTIKEEASSSTTSSGGSSAGALTAEGQALRSQQEAAIAASQRQGQPAKVEPVRKTGKKVGRNDPCPCGSGKKFKACCMKKGGEGAPF